MLKVSSRLDEIAREIEIEDPRIALAIDQVSDSLERLGTVKDNIDIEKHKEHLKKYPAISHPVETVEKLKKKLKDPAIEKKVEEYIKEKCPDFKITDITIKSGEKFKEGKIPVFLQFKMSPAFIDLGHFKRNDFQYIFADGVDLFATALDIPLSVFEVE